MVETQHGKNKRGLRRTCRYPGPKGPGFHGKKKEDKASRKGRIIHLYHEHILVEWFSWLTGEPIFATFHTLEEVTLSEWRFFKNIEDADAYCANNKASILSSN
jgi:hypothetical protein